jgi:hypothetical protein
MSDLLMILFVVMVVGALGVLLMLAVLLNDSIQVRTARPRSRKSLEYRISKRTPLWRWHLPLR